MFRKLLHISFLGMFLLYGMGGGSVFKILEQEAKEKAAFALKHEQLVQLHIQNPQELTWEDEHEFEYQGVMYDVESQEAQPDGSIIFRVFVDTHETQIHTEAAKYHQNQSKHHPKASMNEAPVYLGEASIIPFVQTQEKQIFIAYLNLYSFTFLAVPTPPPQVV